MTRGRELKFNISSIKEEIDKVKCIISGIKIDLDVCTNHNKQQKLCNKKFYMERKLRTLTAERKRLEKEFKGVRREEW